ncbi:ABC transporter substrate-binding protein [Paenibacillus cucumis (ex Kampfer et al. 2016)]|uniref:Carbohydrate ABC transporter substrate-binding protein n=1 Tax=Paenibacillus cucumis (ex Kampfer et al. 2016) TaxID=1776858 RepID=A0ABS7KD91_9BACL|nr:ABC transporter substrate-binding protein [Paenibacillus cucumis (ex Kampfer et al. 2016)]MBY0201912.1 carbohydrate ABC transporter substrate-binding protein [Paenibacillus cucumis (ex Kampfer et al. 2016)]
MKKTWVPFVGVLILMLVITACSSGKTTDSSAKGSDKQAGEASKEVKLTFFNTSAEVNGVFEKLFKTYHELHPEVTIELIPTPIGGAQLEKFQSLLASGNPATIANLDAGTILQYKDKFLNLDSEKSTYEGLTKPGAVDGALLDGQFLGIPWTAQGYGLLYNKRVVEEAMGGSFDPNSIKTRDDLEAVFKKVEAAGKAPVMLHGADWSLGAHYLGLTYSLQSKNVEDNRKFVKDLENGTAKLADNAAFNGLIDTFDLLKKYNARSKDPLVADYTKDSTDFAKGDAAFYFMGDWTWAVIGNLEGRDKEFGIIPVPISNNPEDYGNTQVAYSEPKLFAIDNSGSTEEQQTAAKAFIQWMVTSDEGQDAIVAQMGLALPYKDVKVKSSNILSEAVSSYVDQGKVLNISVINYLPQDYWAKTGASMQKYLAGVIDRNGLAEEVQAYWASQAGK